MSEFFIDIIFAIIAGLGFSYANNPPKRILFYCAILGGLGYASRLMLIKFGIFNITMATFMGSLCIGFCAIFFARRLKVPIEVLSFPALLPMIPGFQAYKTILSVFNFIKSSDESQKSHYLVEFFTNGFITISVVFALTVGVSVVLLFFYEKSFTMTRNGHFRKKYLEN